MNSQHPADVAAANARPKATCDQEVWVKDRIKTAIEMALAVKKCARVGADEPLLTSATEGIVNGAAVEIIRTLGMQPEFKNLRDPSAVVTMVQVGSSAFTPWTGNAGDILEKKLQEAEKRPSYRAPDNRIRLAKLTTYLKTKCKFKLTTNQISVIADLIDPEKPI